MKRYLFVLGVILTALILTGCVQGQRQGRTVDDPCCCCFANNPSKRH